MASTILSSYEEWIKDCCLSAENAIHPINQKETKRAFSDKFKELVSNIKSDVFVDGTTKNKVAGLYNFSKLATATILFEPVKDKDFSKILQENYFLVCGFFWEQLQNTKPAGISQLLQKLNSLFGESSIPVTIRENLSSVSLLALNEMWEFVRTDTVPDDPKRIPYTLTVLTNVFFIGAVNNSYGFSVFLSSVQSFLNKLGYDQARSNAEDMILWGTGKIVSITDSKYSRVKNGLSAFSSLLPKCELKKQLQENEEAKNTKNNEGKKEEKQRSAPLSFPNEYFGRQFVDTFLREIKLPEEKADELYIDLLRKLTERIIKDNRVSFAEKQVFCGQYYTLLDTIEEKPRQNEETDPRERIFSGLSDIKNILEGSARLNTPLRNNLKYRIEQIKKDTALLANDDIIKQTSELLDAAETQLSENHVNRVAAEEKIDSLISLMKPEIRSDPIKILVAEFLSNAFRLAILIDDQTAQNPHLSLTNLREPYLLHDNPKRLYQELEISAVTLGNNRDFDPKKIVESNYFRRLIVAAEGGMGKSTFLRKICKDAVLSDFFSAVIFISLPSLFPPEGKRCPDPTTDEYYYFTTRLLNNFSKDETDMILSLSKGERDYCNPVLIVLDGYNELVSCSDTRLPEIKAEIGRISKDFNNAYIIVSTRPVEKSSPEEIYAYDFGKKYEELQRFSYTATISGVTDDDIKKLKGYDPFTEEIKTLARIPLYYNMLASGLSETPKTKYELLYHKLSADCNQQTNTSLKAVNDPQSFRLSYMVAAPYIARMACTRPGYRLSRNEILEAIDKGKQIFPVLYWDCFKETLGSCLPADIFAVLTNNEILISENSAADE